MYYKFCPFCGSTNIGGDSSECYCNSCDAEWERDDFYWDGCMYQEYSVHCSELDFDVECYSCGGHNLVYMKGGHCYVCNDCGATM